MTLLFIRHASVIKEGKRDSLTSLGKKYSENLPNILKEKGYNKVDRIFYVNKVKSNQPEINRCFETIKNISTEEKKEIKWNELPIQNPESRLGKTIVICYVKNSLKKFPIQPYNEENFYRDKKKTDVLYEQILVIKYELGNYKLIEKIKTGDKATDKKLA